MSIKHIDFGTLLKTKTAPDIYSCVKQIWENGKEWTGFSEFARPRSGFSIFVSPVNAEYRFPNKPTVSAKKGDLVYIPHGEIYTVRFLGGGYDPDMFTLNFDLYDLDGNELLFCKELTIYKNAVTQKLIDCAMSLSDAIIFEESSLKIQALFYELMHSISVQLAEGVEEYFPIRSGAELLTADWNLNKKIGVYANACGMSEGAFYTYFKKWCGRSPVEYRNSLRINSARSLLANTDLSVCEIALRCGFEDPYYFSRMFKKLTGISPREYRRRYSYGIQ